MRSIPTIRASTALIALVVLAACSRGLAPPGGLPGAPAAPAAVERFLQLTAARDYSGMGWLFGTSEGSILERDPPAQVEQRMYALASLLEHDGFVVGNPRNVPGRGSDAFEFDVILTHRGQTSRIPFTTVLGPGGRWYVEQVRLGGAAGAQ